MLLFGIAVVCAIIVLASNKFSSNKEVIIYAVATGLSMIPASLIVVLTITMAAGMKIIVKRHVVRKLDSLEALGGVTGESQTFHITSHLLTFFRHCSDKTGQLTQSKMVVKKAWVPSREALILLAHLKTLSTQLLATYLTPISRQGTLQRQIPTVPVTSNSCSKTTPTWNSS
jgi:magnesium-transporting ATPase (P-type)